MELRLIKRSTELPVAISAAKKHLHLRDDDDLDLLADKVRAATQFCERSISGHRSFVKAKYEGILSDFPDDDKPVEFPLPPLYQISTGTTEGVHYFNSSNTWTALSSTVYDSVIPEETPGWIEPKQNESWPSVYNRPDGVKIRFEAGWKNADAVPAIIKEAILMKTEQLWDPERVKASDIDGAVSALLACMDYGHYG
jgi:hypothetical protein